MTNKTTRDEMLPTPERQANLEAAYDENIKKGRVPYFKVEIHTYGELAWIMKKRNWSGEFPLTDGFVRANLSDANLDGINLNGMSLYGVILRGASCFHVTLVDAELSEADMSNLHSYEADLSSANLAGANLRGANLTYGNLSGAFLMMVNLSNADLFEANLSDVDMRFADLSGAALRGATMNASTKLDGIILDPHTKLGDIRWNETSLLQVNWNNIWKGQQLHLGDEDLINRTIPDDDKLRFPTRKERLKSMHDAVRAYRGLGKELRDQNLSQEASWCRLSEKRLERRTLFLQRTPGSFLAGCGSALLDLVSGYGEIPARTFIAYLTVILSFAGLNFFVTHTLETKLSPLRWDESLVLSLTSFHGRGFFPGSIPLGDWAARIGALEAVIGLFIELILIATFSRRFLSNG